MSNFLQTGTGGRAATCSRVRRFLWRLMREILRWKVKLIRRTKWRRVQREKALWLVYLRFEAMRRMLYVI